MGAYCRLEPNGLKAAQAIHPRLYAAIRAHGVVARPVLVHDTDGEPASKPARRCWRLARLALCTRGACCPPPPV